ncbi:hypothetical protein J4212_05005 [Candidatus Woesearchaeota archaeon]|nr:hypothetical protein [Candidatus Woesearchaeota archaeon]
MAKPNAKGPGVAHLSGGFMIAAIAGFLISVYYIDNFSRKWSFAFALFFTLMFVASVISMTYGPDESMMHVGHRKS